jgi:hypothetical protein
MYMSLMTVNEIAAETKLSRDTIIRLFEKEPGVEVVCRPQRFKRVYRTLRIPVYVKDRVFGAMTNK